MKYCLSLREIPRVEPKGHIFDTKISTFYDINMMVASLAGPILVHILPRGYMDPYWASSTRRIFSRIG